MPRAICVLAAICLLAGSGSLCFVASSTAIAKQKSNAAAKEKTSGALKKKQKSVAARTRQTSSAAKSRKPAASAKEEPRITAQPRTPADKQDCIAVAQAFYTQAQSLAGRTKQSVPQEFQRVVSQLDEFCGEEEFEKARISMDWMHLCLQNFTADNKIEFCSRKEEYFCAVDPRSDACVTSEAHADN